MDRNVKCLRNALKIAVVFWGVVYICACTIKVDNPFYAPSTLDVNKNTSSGAANYLPEKKGQ